MEQLKSLFLQLRTVGDALQKYLLDESCLVLAPEYIFQNVETGEASFLYYPDPEEGTLQDFIDFLVEKVDGEDGEAVETVYRIADLIQREQFVLDEILKWFQDDYDRKKPEEMQPKEIFMPVKTEPEPPLQEEKKENRLKKLMPTAGVCIAGMGLLIYVVCCYQLSYREWIYVAGGFGLIVIIAVCAVSWYLFPFFAKGERKGSRVRNREENRCRKYRTGIRKMPLPSGRLEIRSMYPGRKAAKTNCTVPIGKINITLIFPDFPLQWESCREQWTWYWRNRV